MPPEDYKYSRQERAVIDMVKCWPGIPAQIICETDGTWSVGTLPEHLSTRDERESRERPSLPSKTDYKPNL